MRRRVARSALCVAAIVAMAIYASPSRAGITFDASAVANSNTTEMTWQHTVGPGLDRAMVVGVSIFSANKSVSGITYAGAPFTFVGAQDGGSGANNRRMEIWVLTAPAVGTNDVVLTMTGGSKQVAGSASYFGVDQLSPTSAFTSAQGSSSAASVAVASAADRMVVDCISTKGRAVSLTAGAGQTELWNDVTRTNGGNAMGAGSHTAGSGTTTMTWSLGKSEYWVIGATSLMPAPPRPYLPDAMVKLDTEPDAAYRYDAIYEATASWQVASNGGINGTPFTYPIRFENDGFNADQFLITGTGGDTAFAVQYLDGAGVDRTADVTGFGYVDIPLAPNGFTVWTVRVTPLPNAAGGTSYPVAVTATSSGDPLLLDQVAAVTMSLSPMLSMTKAVDLASATPGQDLTYTIVATTAAGMTDAAAVVLVDPVPSDVGFQIGSATFDPGTTGLTSSIKYSNDNGATWLYTPGTGQCGAPGGYDYCVTHVRWELSGLMPPAQTFSVGFVGRVR